MNNCRHHRLEIFLNKDEDKVVEICFFCSKLLNMYDSKDCVGEILYKEEETSFEKIYTIKPDGFYRKELPRKFYFGQKGKKTYLTETKIVPEACFWSDLTT